VFSLLGGCRLLDLAEDRRDVAAKEIVLEDARAAQAAAGARQENRRTASGPPRAGARSSGPGIPANALIAAASEGFGDGVMRFKQAFSRNADIGD
jgi:hypothetical protein